MAETNRGNREPILFDMAKLEDMLAKGVSFRFGDHRYTVSLARPDQLTHDVVTPASDEVALLDLDDEPDSGPRSRRRARPSRERIPDGRAVREFLSKSSDGATLTVLSREFSVRRTTMTRLLARLLKKGEVEIYKGSYYNNRRLRRRRLPFTPPPVAAGPIPGGAMRPSTPAPAAGERLPERAPAGTGPSSLAAAGPGAGAGAGPAPSDDAPSSDPSGETVH